MVDPISRCRTGVISRTDLTGWRNPVTEFVHAQLSAWESFYVIVGSSGAALVGLQFVVIALIADMRTRTSADALSAFGTPNVVHFTGALLVSAIMSAPWPSLLPLAIVLAVFGFGGLVYSAFVFRRA